MCLLLGGEENRGIIFIRDLFFRGFPYNFRKKPIDNHRNIEYDDLDNKRNMHKRSCEKMLEILFFIFLFGIFGKLFFFGMRAAWSISKLLITIVFLPVILLGMVFGGLLYLAFPILLIIGILSLFRTK